MQRKICLVVFLKLAGLLILAGWLAWNTGVDEPSPPSREMAARIPPTVSPSKGKEEDLSKSLGSIQEEMARLSLEQFLRGNEIAQLEEKRALLRERELQARFELESEFQNIEGIQRRREQSRQEILMAQSTIDLPAEAFRMSLEDEVKSLEIRREELRQEQTQLNQRVSYLNSLNFQTDEYFGLTKRLEELRSILGEVEGSLQAASLRLRTETQKIRDARDWSLAQQRELQTREIENAWLEVNRKYSSLLTELLEIETSQESLRQKLGELREQEREAQRELSIKSQSLARASTVPR